MTSPLPVYPVASAEGCELILSDGRRLVDGMSSWWAAIHGYNHPELARKYGVTERWVRRICGPGQTEGQIDIFDYFNDPGQEDDELLP